MRRSETDLNALPRGKAKGKPAGSRNAAYAWVMVGAQYKGWHKI